MKDMLKIVTLIVTLIGVIACQDNSDPGSRYVEKADEKVCAQQDDYTIDQDSVIQFREIELVREHQEVIRLGCSGEPISQKIEEVSAPKKNVVIRSERRIQIKDSKKRRRRLNGISFNANNRQTCQVAKRDIVEQIIMSPFEVMFSIGHELLGGTPPRKASFKITLDYAPAILTTEVNPGIQMIDYEFTSLCRGEQKRIHRARRDGIDISREDICKKTFEKGTVVFAIRYREVTLPGTKVIEKHNCN